MQSTLSASDLFAIYSGGKNEGDQPCHWCGSPCRRIWQHDDVTPLPFQRTITYARRPEHPWVCLGCWRWRWKRVTVNFIGGGLKDGVCAMDHSWWFSETEAYAVRLDNAKDKAALYERVLHPPLRFCMALLEGSGNRNHLQLALANDNIGGVESTTPLEFTINSIRHTYTTYDLERALREGVQGKPPGVAALVRLLGEHKLAETKDPQKGIKGGHALNEATKAVRKNVVAVKSGGEAA